MKFTRLTYLKIEKLKNTTMKYTLKLIMFSIVILSAISCTVDDDEGCETETVCFGDGDCVERPIPGTCF